jgi:hypothetical protein
MILTPQVQREVARQLAVARQPREVDEVAVEAHRVGLVLPRDVQPDAHRERVDEGGVEVAADLDQHALLLQVELVVGAVPRAHAVVGVARGVLRAGGLRDVVQHLAHAERLADAGLPLELRPDAEQVGHQRRAVVAVLAVAVAAGARAEDLARDLVDAAQVLAEQLLHLLRQLRVLAHLLQEVGVAGARVGGLRHQVLDAGLLLLGGLAGGLPSFSNGLLACWHGVSGWVVSWSYENSLPYPPCARLVFFCAT